MARYGLVNYIVDTPTKPPTEAEQQQLEDLSRGGQLKWIRSNLFLSLLRKDLAKDALALMRVLQQYGTWDPERDAKLSALQELLTEIHPDDKVLVFTQFADTVQYLTDTLSERGMTHIAPATGNSRSVHLSAPFQSCQQ